MWWCGKHEYYDSFLIKYLEDGIHKVHSEFLFEEA